MYDIRNSGITCTLVPFPPILLDETVATPTPFSYAPCVKRTCGHDVFARKDEERLSSSPRSSIGLELAEQLAEGDAVRPIICHRLAARVRQTQLQHVLQSTNTLESRRDTTRRRLTSRLEYVNTDCNRLVVGYLHNLPLPGFTTRGTEIMYRKYSNKPPSCC